jgi:hypothetical protein
MIRIFRAGAGLVLLLGSAMGLSVGCDSTGGKASFEDRVERDRESSLEELGQMLRVRKADATQPPATVTDLAKYEPGFPGGFKKVRSGGIVLMLGAPVEDGASETVLAFEKEAPESGGYVLLQDGTTVKKMTADEFQAATKAPGTPTAGQSGKKGA